MQRAYLDRLAQMVVTPPPGLPDDARALARLQLTRIAARAARALEAGRNAEGGGVGRGAGGTAER